MKAYKLLHDAFRKLDQSTAAWYKNSRFPKTVETANSMLYRNAIVDASTLAYLAACLDLTNKQIAAILDEYIKDVPQKASEVAILKKLIVPIDLSKSEHELIESIRKLPEDKKSLVYAMVASL